MTGSGFDDVEASVEERRGSINLIYVNPMVVNIELRRFDLKPTDCLCLMSERNASRAALKLGIGGLAVSMALKRL